MTEQTPKQLVVSLLVALGVLALVRDLLKIADRFNMAAELEGDPERIHREIGEHLSQEENTDG